MQALSRTVRNILKDFPEVSLVILFGSQVEGNLGPLSDYDFAVLVDRDADGPKVRSGLGSALSRELKSIRIDVVMLREAPIELAFTIISKGVILYERDIQTRVECEARIMGLYFDYLPFLRMAREDIIKGDEHAARARRYRKALGRTQGTLSQIGASQGKEPS